MPIKGYISTLHFLSPAGLCFMFVRYIFGLDFEGDGWFNSGSTNKSHNIALVIVDSLSLCDIYTYLFSSKL